MAIQTRKRPFTSSPGTPVKKIVKSNTLDVWGETYSLVNSVACKAVCCGTAGTVTFIDASGNTCTDYPLQAGYNPIPILQVLTGGTADDIWAIGR